MKSWIAALGNIPFFYIPAPPGHTAGTMTNNRIVYETLIREAAKHLKQNPQYQSVTVHVSLDDMNHMIQPMRFHPMTAFNFYRCYLQDNKVLDIFPASNLKAGEKVPFHGSTTISDGNHGCNSWRLVESPKQ